MLNQFVYVLLFNLLPQTTTEQDAIDSKGIPGWGKVDALARALIDLRGLSVSNSDADRIIMLYNALHEFNKESLIDQLSRSQHQEDLLISRNAVVTLALRQ